MAEDEKSYLARCLTECRCPYCGEELSTNGRYGGGKLEDGAFCSLEHYGQYYAQELSERHRKRVEKTRSDRDG